MKLFNFLKPKKSIQQIPKVVDNGPKFCFDCTNIRYNNSAHGPRAICAKFAKLEIDLVYGGERCTISSGDDAYTTRDDENKCGKSAKFFESRHKE